MTVYRPEDNADLASVHGFAAVPHWRWTHGHVGNVSAAIATAARHEAARNAVFNVGEAHTRTMGERLADLPARSGEPPTPPPFDYAQPLVIDTAKIRRQLGNADLVDERAAMSVLVA